jgi:hypothetical protein
MVTTDKVQGMQRKVVLVTVGVIALAVVAVKLFAPSYVTSDYPVVSAKHQMLHKDWICASRACGLLKQPNNQNVTSLRQSRELTRRQNLLTMRAVLSQYTLDTHRRPRSLDDLVIAGYLKHVPLDPMTGRKDTWLLKCSSDPASPGIVSISPGNPSAAIKGTAQCD